MSTNHVGVPRASRDGAVSGSCSSGHGAGHSREPRRQPLKTTAPLHRNQPRRRNPPNSIYQQDARLPDVAVTSPYAFFEVLAIGRIGCKCLILLVPKGGIEPPRSQGPRDFETTSRSFEVVRRRSKQFETVQLGGRRRFGLVLSCSKDFEGVFT